MSDIYARLKTAGFDSTFIRDAVLPEWWEDSLASVPSNRAIAEFLVSRHLGVPMQALADRSRPLEHLNVPHVKFKRHGNSTDDRVKPSVVIAKRAAEIFIKSSCPLPEFKMPAGALAIRQTILLTSKVVDLKSLLEFCWNAGVLVFHANRRPERSCKHFDGLAMYCGERPVLVLGSNRDGPAWVAFHLAHELSHILRRHVRPGGDPLVDEDLKSKTDDLEERQADEDACEILTGQRSLHIDNLKLTSKRLAAFASKVGPSQSVDPGVYALFYARSNDRWPVAVGALKMMKIDSGARDILQASLRKRINPDNISEDSGRFIAVVSSA